MSKNGLVVDGEGWFILNARESRWRNEGPLGSYCTFEGKRRFPSLESTSASSRPGEAMGMYHSENAQEGFLVLAGECLLIVEEQERRLQAWDFFHCPGGTQHIIVAQARKRRSWWPSAPADAGSVAASSIRFRRSQPAMAPASSAKRQAQPRRTRRCAPIYQGRTSSNTDLVGCPKTPKSGGTCPPPQDVSPLARPSSRWAAPPSGPRPCCGRR